MLIDVQRYAEAVEAIEKYFTHELCKIDSRSWNIQDRGYPTKKRTTTPEIALMHSQSQITEIAGVSR